MWFGELLFNRLSYGLGMMLHGNQNLNSMYLFKWNALSRRARCGPDGHILTKPHFQPLPASNLAVKLKAARESLVTRIGAKCLK